MSCDFLYSTEGIWLWSRSIYVISDMTDTWECKYTTLSAASVTYWSSDAGPATRTLSYSLESAWPHGRCPRLCSSDTRAGNDYVQPQGQRSLWSLRSLTDFRFFLCKAHFIRKKSVHIIKHIWKFLWRWLNWVTDFSFFFAIMIPSSVRIFLTNRIILYSFLTGVGELSSR